MADKLDQGSLEPYICSGCSHALVLHERDEENQRAACCVDDCSCGHADGELGWLIVVRPTLSHALLHFQAELAHASLGAIVSWREGDVVSWREGDVVTHRDELDRRGPADPQGEKL